MVRRSPGSAVPILLAASLLTWPALWNGYPLVFSDTGTYLSQAIHGYLGWDRPVFYSLFLYPLHLRITTWPAVVAQALLAAHMLHLLARVLAPSTSPWWASRWWLPGLAGALAALTSLPFLASELIADLFTPLLILALALLVLAPGLLSGAERLWLAAFSTFMIAVHQSHPPLALALLALLLPARRWLGAVALPGRNWPWHALLALPLACAALLGVNLIGHGRAALSPFGNAFLLARVIYDGPGMAVLARDCPAAGWRLCAYAGHFPPTADGFLWRADSPLVLAGGAKLVSDEEAGAIILAALRAEPGTEAHAFLVNAATQFAQFATGDGLQPWPGTVTPWIARDFPPAEFAAYQAARQSRGELSVPPALLRLHQAAAWAGLAGCAVLAVLGLRRRHPLGGFAVAVLLGLLVNAAITGGLSGPHDRYQSRVIWLPLALVLLAPLSLPHRRATTAPVVVR
jgi:hypothetical protein